MGWQIWQIMSYPPQFSSPIFTDTPKMYLAYELTVAYSPNFPCQQAFLPVWFAKNFPHQIFSMYSNPK